VRSLAIALWFALVIVACADDEPEALPTCVEAGCPDTNALLCKSREICVCQRPQADPIDCRVTPSQ
jgi:hypothetical protein